ncbi:putative ACR, YagE family [Geosmithia morbida]|uniref:ACR, YagE family n=1 Tax=Geosmithia morbida TaxID=1094350 RepID=A0A9P5D948_9HYPO|nr:putative ACR, YagE family [Geosmithia morbida]KAF4126139.1 putative ACR, YagE family [Geosmithia morbida]
MPRKRNFFTSNTYMSQNGDDAEHRGVDASTTYTPTNDHQQSSPHRTKRKATRATSTKGSLRRVAMIAQQQPKQEAGQRASQEVQDGDGTNMMSATCVAESFDMAVVLDALTSHGFSINPDGIDFDAGEVVHARGVNGGDIFVFPSGTVVTWSLPADVVTRQLLRAAQGGPPHPPHLRELEDLEFTTDTSRESSTVRGDVVVLGTRREVSDGDRLDTTLAKVAFSSGLARSAKLAVLETALTAYFESTREIPAILSRGSGFPFGRRFILQKTGELLDLRARLNHYSELTDSLPDILWDSRADLGLEGYYELVGRALDVSVRIRTLNQKMDYAQEIATVLREMSSEQHGTRLEVIIILLITVEVVFELRRIYLEYTEPADPHPPAPASASATA